MPRSLRWSRTALVAVTTIVVAACGGTTASPAASTPASAGAPTEAPTPADSQAAFTSTVYPETGEAPDATKAPDSRGLRSQQVAGP